MGKKIRILLVEDNPEDVRLIQECLKDATMMDLELSVVDNLTKAKTTLEEGPTDLILLSLALPDSTDLKPLNEAITVAPTVPVIVLTRLSDAGHAMEAINRGAQDYLVKDMVNTDMLVRSIHYALHRKQVQVEIEQSEMKYRSLWENSVTGLAHHELVTDDEGQPIDSIFSDVNPRFEELTGLRKEDVIGKRLSDVKPGILRTDINPATTFWKVALTGEPMSFEFHNPEAERWFSISVYSPSHRTFVCALQDITERKLTEEQLRESEMRYRELYEEVRVGLLTTSVAEGRIVNCNAYLIKMFGFESQEQAIAEGLSPIRYVNIEERQQIISELKKNGVFNGELALTKMDGTPIWVKVNSRIDLKEGTIESAFMDITEQKKAEEKLRKSEERYRGIFEHSAYGVVLASLDDEIIDVNSAMENILGYTYNELCKMKIADFSHPDDDVEDKKLAQQLLRGETEIFRMEKRYIKKNGDIIWANLTVSSIRDERGHVEFFIGIIEDITEKKQTESDLKFERERYVSVLNTLDDGIYVVDKNYDVEYANHVIESEFGPIAGRKCYTHLHDRKEPCPWCQIDKVFAGNTVRWDWYSEKNDKYYELYETPMKNTDGSISKFQIFHDITERKLADEQLRESEQRNRIIANAMSDLILIYDKDIRLREYYTSDESLLFLPWEKMDGKRLEEFMPSEYSDTHYKNVKHARETGENVIFEYDLEIDSTLRWFQGTMMLHEDRESIVVAVKDITERKQAEENLTKSEERFRLLFETAPLATAHVSLSGTIHQTNKAFEKTFGYSQEESNHLTVESITHPDDWELETKFAQEMEVGLRDSFEIEKRFFHKDGHQLWGRLNVSIARDPQFVVGTVEDITDRKKSEEALRASEERHRLVLSSMNDLIFVMDKNNVYVEFYASDKISPLVPPEVFIGKNVTETLPSEVVQRITECAARVRETGDREELEYSLMIDNEKVWYSAMLDIHQDGESIVTAVRDISEERKAQRETKQAAETAMLYLDIMGHDIRNHLQAVIMASDILEHQELGLEVSIALDIISESVQNSQRLISKVHATRDLLSAPMSSISLRGSLVNSLKNLKKTYDDIEVEVKYHVKDPFVFADEFLEQLLNNILENAVEHSEMRVRKVWVELQESAEGYTVSIKDNGPGISDEEKETLFDASRRFGGVGIHQSIKLLQKYGGDMTVHDRVTSDPSQGSEFRIRFPKGPSVKSKGR